MPVGFAEGFVYKGTALTEKGPRSPVGCWKGFVS